MEEIVLNKPYITLGQILQISGFASSGAETKYLVKKLPIYVNGLSENRRGRKLYANDKVDISGRQLLIKSENTKN